jgi:DNA-binding response OmpR family regulator
MTAENVRRLVLLSRQLNECLMSAALCTKELGAIAHAETDHHDGGNGQTRRPLSSENSVRPLMDESTLSVMWNGQTLHLGNTQGFWLLTRLLRCANRYVTHVDLLREIWDDEFADTGLLRAGIQRLRVKLRRGGGLGLIVGFLVAGPLGAIALGSIYAGTGAIVAATGHEMDASDIS